LGQKQKLDVLWQRLTTTEAPPKPKEMKVKVEKTLVAPLGVKKRRPRNKVPIRD
jgi:hypothetical protein